MGLKEENIITTPKVYYIDGMKYQTTADFQCNTWIRRPEEEGIIKTRHIKMFPNGKLVIKAGYAWDGASGPTKDTKNSMRGSLIHDALYQLMRIGKLNGRYRNEVDELLESFCLKDGMWRWRAWAWYKAVRKFASGSACSDGIRKVKVAP